jgi:anti-sigma factor RsiW
MSCSFIDLKAYLFGEADAAGRRAVEEHLHSCGACREEHQRLTLTQAALLTVRDEDIPRRIAFVSDKVFEPAWYRRLWQSGPRLGFAGAAMLSCAILVHAFYAPATPTGQPPIASLLIEKRVEAEVALRLDYAVQKAVAAVEERHAKRNAELLAASEKRMALQHEETMAEVGANFRVMNERVNYYIKQASSVASADLGGSQ